MKFNEKVISIFGKPVEAVEKVIAKIKSGEMPAVPENNELSPVLQFINAELTKAKAVASEYEGYALLLERLESVQTILAGAEIFLDTYWESVKAGTVDRGALENIEKMVTQLAIEAISTAAITLKIAERNA